MRLQSLRNVQKSYKRYSRRIDAVPLSCNFKSMKSGGSKVGVQLRNRSILNILDSFMHDMNNTSLTS
jgi:hypothetical protein